jgi:hypothetical protein
MTQISSNLVMSSMSHAHNKIHGKPDSPAQTIVENQLVSLNVLSSQNPTKIGNDDVLTEERR